MCVCVCKCICKGYSHVWFPDWGGLYNQLRSMGWSSKYSPTWNSANVYKDSPKTIINCEVGWLWGCYKLFRWSDCSLCMGTEPIPILQHSEVRFIGICSNSQTSCSFFPCLLVNAMFFDDCALMSPAGLDSCSNEPQTWFEPLCLYCSLATNHPKVSVTSPKSGMKHHGTP